MKTNNHSESSPPVRHCLAHMDDNPPTLTPNHNPNERTPDEIAEIRKNARRIALECPECFSHRAELIHTRVGNTAMCLDCDAIYKTHFRHVDLPNDPASSKPEPTQEPPKKRKKHKSWEEQRASIVPAQAPAREFNTTVIDEAIASGPVGVRQAQRVAMRFAKRFQQEIEDKWRRPTQWLIAKQQSDDSNGSARACARYALVWRPKFLAALSITRNVTMSSRFARIPKKTAHEHRKQDAEFAQLWQDAEEETIDLLHARTFQRAIEGDCEPIMFMGVPVAYVRKFDSKLQIEMLRAYRPERFKTPGDHTTSIGTTGDVFVLTEKQRHRLIEVNKEFLRTTPHPNSAECQIATEQPQQLTNGEPVAAEGSP